MLAIIHHAFIFLSLIYKPKHQTTQSYNFSCCFVWVCNMVVLPNGKTCDYTKIIWEQTVQNVSMRQTERNKTL